jgi:hypothetical protein
VTSANAKPVVLRRREWHRTGVAGQKAAVTANNWLGSRRRGPHRATVVLAIAGLTVIAAIVVVVVATRSAGGTGPGGGTGPRAGTRAVSVAAGPAGTVDLNGVPGQLTITGSASGGIRLSGQLHWSGHAPQMSVRTEAPAAGNPAAGHSAAGRSSAGYSSAGNPAAGRTLRLDYACAAGSPCTEDFRLTVPAGTAVVLSQPSGHVRIAGLDGSLRISAASVDVSATGLRSPALTASITSGHLSAAFARAPRRVSLKLTSAQATVRLPGTSPGYQVSSQVVSGYVHVGVARAASSPDQVRAQITSGELELLP